MARDFRSTRKWVPGTIVDRTGPLSYTVILGNGKIIHRHIDQLHNWSTPSAKTPTDITIEDFEPFQDYQLCELLTQSPNLNPVTTVRRYPQRERWPPDHFVAWTHILDWRGNVVPGPIHIHVYSLWFHMHLPLFSPNTSYISVSLSFPYKVVLFSVWLFWSLVKSSCSLSVSQSVFELSLTISQLSRLSCQLSDNCCWTLLP